MPSETPSQIIAREMLARFPIVAKPVEDTRVTGNASFWVGIPEMKVSLNKAAPETEIGRYDARVHIESKDAGDGFTGGAYYRFLDENGNVVYAMMGDGYGVNGTAVPGAPSDRTENEAKIIPLDILTAVHAVEAIPDRMEGDTLDRLKETINKIVEGSKAIGEGLKEIGATVGEVAASIRGS